MKNILGRIGLFLLFSLPFFLAGSYLIYSSIHDWGRDSSSQRWPSTPGQVISSKMITDTDDEGAWYRAEIEYEYEVQQTKHRRDMVRFAGTGSQNPADARRWVNRYPENSLITVYYNPQDPHDSVLVPEFRKNGWLGILFGLVAVLSSLPFAYPLIQPFVQKPFSQISKSSKSKTGIRWERAIPWAPGVFVLIGVGIFSLGIRNLDKGKETLHWPQVPGVILSSHMSSYLSESRDSDGYTTYTTFYKANLLYEYKIQNHAYSGGTVKYGETNSSDQKETQAILDHYPVGKKVAVYYNPKDLYEAVLEPGVHGNSWALLIVGGVFAGMGVLFIILLKRFF